MILTGTCMLGILWYSYRRQGNIRGFSTITVFVEMFSRCLGHKYSLFSINKERHLYSRKKNCGTPENCENLAHPIFPRLWYMTALRLLLLRVAWG